MQDFCDSHNAPERLDFLQPETLDAKLFKELQRTREAFLATTCRGLGSLASWCQEVSTFVSETLGLPRVSGFYYHPKDNPCFSGLRAEHSWNSTSDGLLFVDLTLQQFNTRGIYGTPDIAIITAVGQRVLRPDSSAEINGHPLNTFELKEEIRSTILGHLQNIPS